MLLREQPFQSSALTTSLSTPHLLFKMMDFPLFLSEGLKFLKWLSEACWLHSHLFLPFFLLHLTTLVNFRPQMPCDPLCHSSLGFLKSYVLVFLSEIFSSPSITLLLLALQITAPGSLFSGKSVYFWFPGKFSGIPFCRITIFPLELHDSTGWFSCSLLHPSCNLAHTGTPVDICYMNE